MAFNFNKLSLSPHGGEPNLKTSLNGKRGMLFLNSVLSTPYFMKWDKIPVGLPFPDKVGCFFLEISSYNIIYDVGSLM